MVRKRPYTELLTWPDRLAVYSDCLDEMCRDQDNGKAHFGESVYEDPDRARRSLTFFTGVQYAPINSPIQQFPPPQYMYTMPQRDRVIATEQEVEDILQGMTQDTEVSEEEARIIADARSLGWTWAKVASVLRGRTGKQLIRICTQPSKAKRPSTVRRDYSNRDKEDGRGQPREQTARVGPASGVTEAANAARREKRERREREKEKGKEKEKEKEKTPEIEESNKSGTSNQTSGLTGIETDGVVNTSALNRSGGESRVALKRPLSSPPEDFTGMQKHNLKSLEGVKFHEEVEVIDPDDPGRVFKFSIKDQIHCACFNIGEGKDGSPLLSWSDLYALYELPDGSKWAEHGYLYDDEDLENFAKKFGKEYKHLIPDDMGKQELIKKKGRYHSRLQNIEYECWVYRGELPRSSKHGEDAYYYRVAFDPETMQKIDE